MNCKPGDLAMYVGLESPEEIGKIVLVVKRRNWNVAAWYINPHIRDRNGILNGSALDSALRPIRDPGDDATDEMIQRLGSPNKQEQTA